MSKQRPTKSRTQAKSSTKSTKGKINPWKALVVVGLVAVVGVLIVRFSQASSTKSFYVTGNPDGGLNSNNVKNAYEFGIEGYTASNTNVAAELGPGNYSAGPNEGWNDFTGGADVGHVVIRVCWTMIVAPTLNTPPILPNTYQYHVQSSSGDRIAEGAKTVYATGTFTDCLDARVNAPLDPNATYSYHVGNGTSHVGLFLVKVTRTVTSLGDGGGSEEGNWGTGTVPAPPPTNPDHFSVYFGEDKFLNTVCGYGGDTGWALICPDNFDQWEYRGYPGDKQYIASAGIHEHNVGTWYWQGWCGVKSRISNPGLPFYANNALYILPCENLEATAEPIPEPPAEVGAIVVTKYGPRGPKPPNGLYRSNRSTEPGNTRMCIKNKHGVTFGCSNENSWTISGLLTSDDPYTIEVQTPQGWYVSEKLVNGKTAWPATANSSTAFAHKDDITWVDFYFDADPNVKSNIKVNKYGPGQSLSSASSVPGNASACFANRFGEIFGCSNANPTMMSVYSQDDPYVIFATAPSGWKVTNIKINGQVRQSNQNNFKNTDLVIKNVSTQPNQTTTVDIYYERE